MTIDETKLVHLHNLVCDIVEGKLSDVSGNADILIMTGFTHPESRNLIALPVSKCDLPLMKKFLASLATKNQFIDFVKIVMDSKEGDRDQTIKRWIASIP